LFMVEVEQHALAFREFAPVHEALGLLRGRGRHLDGEHMHTALAGDLERLQFGCGKTPRYPDEWEGDDKYRGKENKQATRHGQRFRSTSADHTRGQGPPNQSTLYDGS